MNIKSGRLTVSFFTVTVFILLFITYFSFQRLQNLISYTNQVNQTHELRLEISTLLSLLKDAETGQRGYLITRDSFFLEPYLQSLPGIDSSFIRLSRLTKDEALQRDQLKVLKILMDKRLRILENTIAFLQRDDSLKFRSSLLTGKQTMDEVRRIAAKMFANEQRNLDELIEERSRYESLTPMLLLILSLFALLAVTGTFLIIRRQLSERMRIQAQLTEKVDALNRSNNELEQFAYVASHDLQEPLRKIQAFGDKLITRHADGLNEDGINTIERMRNSAARMQALINELLSFSRLAQREKEQAREVALNEVVREVLSDLQLMIEDKRALIEAGPLPVIHGVSTQLRQLFQNLLSNALKFSRAELTPRITVTSDIVNGTMIKLVKSTDQHLKFHRITVADNGIGFDEQYQEKIFVIFQRLHGKLEYTGTGIGLAICRKICTYHGGYIQAESQPGKGARFMVFLPV